jgi:hypothetical protein
MQSETTVSITLPPELFIKAKARAEREHRTMSELLSDALRKYMQQDPEWEALLKRTRATGHQLGITDEDAVERLSDQYRLEKQ